MSILNFHYALPESVTWNLGAQAARSRFDESGFAGHDDTLYRRQAWRFLMAGGAVFSGLDYSFAVGFEKGTAENDAPGGGSAALRSQLGVLKRTLDATGLVAMRPDRGRRRVGTGRDDRRALAARAAVPDLRRGPGQDRPDGVAARRPLPGDLDECANRTNRAAGERDRRREPAAGKSRST